MDDDYDISNDAHLYCDEETEHLGSRFALETFTMESLPDISSMFECSCGETVNLHITSKYMICGTCGKVTPQY